MLIDLSPLKKYREYRLLFIGQLVSMFGSMITYVALPFQVYELTKSTLAVGIIGTIELIPLLLTAFLGGAFADTMDRKKLIIYSELGMLITIVILTCNSMLQTPSVILIYFLAGIMSALNGFHRPSLDALGPRLVEPTALPAYSALNSFKSVLGTVAGPAVAGLCITSFGWVATYLIDVATFIVSLVMLSKIKNYPVTVSENRLSFAHIKEGIKYACSRQELIGTYLIDFVAMVFSMPTALFPAIAAAYHQTELIGLFYAAPAAGSLLASIFSGWTKNISRHGLAISIAASMWGGAIIGLGFANNHWLALACLVIAGMADMVSAIFRTTIWNQTIPDDLRGRLAGIEMISYMSGPLLGNTQAGMLASIIGLKRAIIGGGLLCIAGVGICTRLLPKFSKYTTAAPDNK